MATGDKSIKVVDFFCGAGGLTHGLMKANLNVVAGVDSDKECEFPYTENNKPAKFIAKKIEDVSATELRNIFTGAKWKVIVGCAPCQPFSSYMVKVRKPVKNTGNKNTGNWNLIEHFMEKIEAVMPDVISMENVPQLNKEAIFDDFLAKLKNLGYMTTVEVVNCAHYGIPQSRRRLVLLASKHKKIELPEPARKQKEKQKTLRATIESMPEIAHGEQHAKDRLHFSAKLEELNLKRIKSSKPGGTWEDWPKNLLPECYKRPGGQTYKNVHGRLDWDKPSPTITGQFYRYGTGRFGHPQQHRALSLREGALIQTFPRHYKFVPRNKKIAVGTVGRHIGNAVPVALGKIIGKTIIQHIEEINHGQ